MRSSPESEQGQGERRCGIEEACEEGKGAPPDRYCEEEGAADPSPCDDHNHCGAAVRFSSGCRK